MKNTDLEVTPLPYPWSVARNAQRRGIERHWSVPRTCTPSADQDDRRWVGTAATTESRPLAGADEPARRRQEQKAGGSGFGCHHAGYRGELEAASPTKENVTHVGFNLIHGIGSWSRLHYRSDSLVFVRNIGSDMIVSDRIWPGLGLSIQIPDGMSGYHVKHQTSNRR